MKRDVYRQCTAVFLACGATALGLLLPATAAQASEFINNVQPAPQSKANPAPSSIQLTFDQAPTGTGMSVRVTDQRGRSWEQGQPSLSGPTVVQPLAGNAPAGTYTVQWSVVKTDGSPVNGSYSYEVTTGQDAGGVGESPAPEVVPSPGEEDKAVEAAGQSQAGKTPVPALIGLGALALFGISAVVAVLMAAKRGKVSR